MPRLEGVRLHTPAPTSPRAKPIGSARSCPTCGYELRGIVGKVCPECGLEMAHSRATFQTAHWNVPQFYIGALGLFAGLFPAFYTGAVILTAAGFDFTGTDLADRFNLFILITWCAGSVKMGMSWVNWSGTMAAWPRVKHWLVAFACWLLPLGGLGAGYLMGAPP